MRRPAPAVRPWGAAYIADWREEVSKQMDAAMQTQQGQQSLRSWAGGLTERATIVLERLNEADRQLYGARTSTPPNGQAVPKSDSLEADLREVGEVLDRCMSAAQRVVNGIA